MKLADLLKMVEVSDRDDWHKLEVQTVYGWEHGDDWSVPKTFSELFIFKEDVDISVALAATVNKDFAEPWAQKFPDPKANSVAVILRYRGAVVYEWVGVSVDGGRYLLPMPDVTAGGDYEVPKAKMPTAELLFHLFGSGGVHKSAASALQQAGVSIV